MKCLIPSRDLSQKIGNSVCLYDGHPVYVVVDRGSVYIQSLPNRENSTKIKPSDDKFDISSPPLGYIQYDNHKVLYLSRIPVRRSKQGLDERSLRVRELPQEVDQRNSKKGRAYTNAIYTKGFVDMVLNNYKPLDNILKELRGKHKANDDRSYEAAVMRNIALSINPLGIINVYLKNDLIGWMAPDSNVVRVPQSDRGWIISKYLSHELTWEVD